MRKSWKENLNAMTRGSDKVRKRGSRKIANLYAKYEEVNRIEGVQWWFG